MKIVLSAADIRKLCIDEKATPVMLKDNWVKLMRLTNDGDNAKYFLSDLHNRQSLTDHLTAEEMAKCLDPTLLQPCDYHSLFSIREK